MIAQSVDFSLKFHFIKQVELVGQFFAAGRELLDPFQAQKLFDQLNAGMTTLDNMFVLLKSFVTLLELNLFNRELLLKIRLRPISAAERLLKSDVVTRFSGVVFRLFSGPVSEKGC